MQLKQRQEINNKCNEKKKAKVTKVSKIMGWCDGAKPDTCYDIKWHDWFQMTQSFSQNCVKKHFRLLRLDARMGGCSVEARVGVWRGPKAATSSSLDLPLLPPTPSCSSKNPASKIFQKSWFLHPGLVTFTRSWRKEYELFLCKERRGERQGGDEAQERGKIFLNLISSDHMRMWWDGHMTLWREENMIMLLTLCNDTICKGKVERCVIDMMPQHGPAY